MNGVHPLSCPFARPDTNSELSQSFSSESRERISSVCRVLPDAPEACLHVPAPVRSPGGVSSIVGRFALPYASSYVATKFAVEGLSESMRYELEPFRIRVKMVEPGSIATEFGKGSKQIAVSDLYRARMDKFLGVFAKEIPERPSLKRWQRSFMVPQAIRAIGCVTSPSLAHFSG